MDSLPLGTDGIKMIIELRSEFLDFIFKIISYMGEVEGYILIITFIYMLINKELAFRLSLLALISMSLNHFLKSVLAISRPFVNEGTYLEHWLVSKENAHELVTEFSTPSGHAMSSSTFYGYLFTKTNTGILKCLLIVIIILVGFSRNYLAVHYIEDILLGWVFGSLIIFSVLKYSKELQHYWQGLTLLKKMSVIIFGSLILWISTFYINGGQISTQPLPFVGYLGFLLGVCLGYSLEEKYLNFDPKSKYWYIKLIRWIITIILVMIPVIILDETFKLIWSEPTLFSHILQYFGYALSGFLGIFIAPCMLLKLRMLDPIINKQA